MYCENCGETVLPGARYCDCGAPLPLQGKSTDIQARPPREKGEPLGLFTSLTGIGLGSMDIQLEKYHYYCGERLRGRIILHLKAPAHAARLAAGLYAHRTIRTRTVNSKGELATESRSVKVYEFEYNVDGTGEYQTCEYPLELVIPLDACGEGPHLPEGALGDIARVVAYFIDDWKSPVYWVVYGTLEIPWKAAIRKKVQITVTQRKETR
ncbi:MAG: zinc ribbon domain-containing protein [Candidatus Eremiobacteraeota bacterium]|nr:zinc ribbon domain-containing protein [Candidatus Eremiobacteraeota bacterium]